MKRASPMHHMLIGYAWICAFAAAAGTLSGLAWGVVPSILVGAGFLAACTWVHWLVHRIIARSRRASVPQRRFPEV